jgi:prepilin-type N-terminal cleavage/methylation domain-containing protein
MIGRNAASGLKPAGFTMLEVLLVVSIGLIITAIGLPVMSNAIAMTKLRSSMTTVSGLLQNTRMVAVQQNKTKTACHYNWTTPPYGLIYFAKDAVDCTTSPAPVETDPQVELQAPISAMATPAGPGAPSAIPNSTLGLTASPLTSDPSFNSRGLPCAYSSGTCSGNAFIQYFKDNRIGGSGGWSAITVSPAGRINRWFWNGSTWTN